MAAHPKQNALGARKFYAKPASAHQTPTPSPLAQPAETYSQSSLAEFHSGLSATTSPIESPLAQPFTPAPQFIQLKLRVGAVNDPLEREADRMAETVMRLPGPVSSATKGSSSGAIQRKSNCACGGSCAKCSGDTENTNLLRKAKGAGNAPRSVPGIVNKVVGSFGQPLDSATRSFMEPRFGQDFSRVRVHTDSQAATAAQSVQARAFTLGSDVVFNRGEYAPNSPSGKKLLAHELTHVVQQSQSNETILSRACLPAADCAGPIPGSAGSFGAGEVAIEAPARTRRQRMTCARATATSHAGHAVQLEIFMNGLDPALRSKIHGVFIDADLSSGTGAMVDNCLRWMNDTLPAGCRPPDMAGATKPCVLVHGELNQQALLFNQGTATTIDGRSREDWKTDTFALLSHEAQHVVFDTSGRAEPPGAVGCPRSSVQGEVTELNAIMSEFPIFFRAIPAVAGPARTHAENRLADWFRHSITNQQESIVGTLKAMRCQCNCPAVDAHVQDIFNLVTTSWNVAEKTAFNVELRKARWNVAPFNVNWPL